MLAVQLSTHFAVVDAEEHFALAERVSLAEGISRTLERTTDLGIDQHPVRGAQSAGDGDTEAHRAILRDERTHCTCPGQRFVAGWRGFAGGQLTAGTDATHDEQETEDDAEPSFEEVVHERMERMMNSGTVFLRFRIMRRKASSVMPWICLSMGLAMNG